jgi:serine/threonine-protein kinase
LLRARQKLGKYRILGRIASGPLADVYKAADTIHKTRVALKIPKQAHGASHEDFLHEVQVATRLQHPNILTVQDASFIDGNFVIAMELGTESLADRIARRISTTHALDLADQALAGLAYAHEKKIIHCDIKPENYILFPGNRLKLADFGFAKISLRTLKASGSGTIDYIAPEQAMGRPKFQSDVFSVGLVLYRLLSGKLPEWPFKSRKQRRASARNGSNKTAKPGSSWKQLQWREFQRHFRAELDTRHQCRRCEGPVAEGMKACPWCGFDNPARGATTRMPAHCPRCERGVKIDWNYCAWCYGPGFEAETTRRYSDKRYTSKCSNTRCKQPLMPFMRYCPWCRSKVKRPWKIAGSKHKCKACSWGIVKEYWNFCAWCREPVKRT